eukprot:g6365.t1
MLFRCLFFVFLVCANASIPDILRRASHLVDNDQYWNGVHNESNESSPAVPGSGLPLSGPRSSGNNIIRDMIGRLFGPDHGRDRFSSPTVRLSFVDGPSTANAGIASPRFRGNRVAFRMPGKVPFATSNPVFVRPPPDFLPFYSEESPPMRGEVFREAIPLPLFGGPHIPPNAPIRALIPIAGAQPFRDERENGENFASMLHDLLTHAHRKASASRNDDDDDSTTTDRLKVALAHDRDMRSYIRQGIAQLIDLQKRIKDSKVSKEERTNAEEKMNKVEKDLFNLLNDDKVDGNDSRDSEFRLKRSESELEQQKEDELEREENGFVNDLSNIFSNAFDEKSSVGDLIDDMEDDNFMTTKTSWKADPKTGAASLSMSIGKLDPKSVRVHILQDLSLLRVTAHGDEEGGITEDMEEELPLPYPVEDGQVKANVDKDGMLTITLPAPKSTVHNGETSKQVDDEKAKSPSPPHSPPKNVKHDADESITSPLPTEE